MERPRPIRNDECARSSLAFSARKTYEGLSVAEVHADPEDTHISGIPSIIPSPSTPSKLKFKHPGMRFLDPHSDKLSEDFA